jgi:replicative DNA helicase
MEKEGSQESSIELLREFGFQPIRAAVRQSIAVVDQARKGLRVVFPTKWSRLNRHLLGGLQPGKMYVIAGRPGCLSGDTQIFIRRNPHKEGTWYSLKDVYRKVNGIGGSQWSDNIPTDALSYMEWMRTGHNRIEQVIESGIKETFCVRTNTGKRIRATADHRFLTSTTDTEDAWKPLSALTPGDRIVCTSSFDFPVARVSLEKIVSIDDPYTEMTYDISMRAPYHNFVADGFVVHNSGKSALSNQMLFDILDLAALAKKKVVVFYWSFEMPGYQQILRSASKDTGKSLNDFYSVDRSMDDIGFKQFCASVSKLLPYPIYFQNKPRPVKDIVNICLAYSAKNPDVTIINLIDHSRLVPDSEVQQEMERLNILSKACMYMQAETEEKVINILLSQLNRNIEREDRAKNQYQPLLTDLFGGDSIGQDSHVVMMIQRPHDMYGITATYCGEDPRGLLALHIEKNRDGMLGMLPYDFDGARFTITERKKA